VKSLVLVIVLFVQVRLVTADQKHFKIAGQVAADWRELMIPLHTMHCSHLLPTSVNSWICGLQLADILPPQSATLGLHLVAC